MPKAVGVHSTRARTRAPYPPTIPIPADAAPVPVGGPQQPQETFSARLGASPAEALENALVDGVRPSSGIPTRRKLITGAAVAALAVGAAVNVPAIALTAAGFPGAASTPSVHPDQLLLDLGRRYDAALQAEQVALEKYGACSDACAAADPPPPDALKVRPGDADLELVPHYEDGFGPSDVKAWRRLPLRRRQEVFFEASGRPSLAREIDREEAMRKGGPDDDRIISTFVRRPCPLKQARVYEIVAAWDGYVAACEAVAASFGYDEAQAAYSAAVDARQAIGDAIVACRAMTLQGLAVRARIVADMFGDDDNDEAHLTTDMKMMFAIVRDLARMDA